jgi:hypothetical protein
MLHRFPSLHPHFSPSGGPTLSMNLLARGVHRCPVLSSDGNPIIISVDHNHHEVQRRAILPGENPVSVAAILWEHLDLVDPEHSRRSLERAG